MKKIIVVHPTGNQNVRGALKSFSAQDLLGAYYTSIAVFRNSFLYRLSNFSFLKELKRRSYDDRIQKITHSWPLLELARVVSEKKKWDKLTMHETGVFSIDALYRNMDQHVANAIRKKKTDNISAVYAYEDCALKIFTEAKKKGLTCIYELPTGYWRASKRLLGEGLNTKPAWAESYIGLQDSDAKLQTKDREIGLADAIIVASSFVANTLKEYPGKLPPVHVVPYGFPPALEQRTYQPLKNRKLKMLYIGRLTQQKGIGDIFDAIKNLEDKVELTVVGKITKRIQILEDNLAQHTYYPSLSNTEILGLMQQQDVFVFPSQFEGFGLVITEAMSRGTPVITTDRTCGLDIIRDGENGWLVPASNTDALRKKIIYLLDNPEVLAKVGSAALQTARGRSWTDYENDLARTVKGYIQ